MTRALNAAAMLIMLAIVAGVGGLAWLVYRLAENTVQTIDRTWGPAFYQIAAAASLLAFVLVVVGGALALVRWMARRSRHVHARDGLYPVIAAVVRPYVIHSPIDAQPRRRRRKERPR